MKTAVWYNNNDIRIEETPTPRPGPDEMVVKVMSCGICGSDIVEWYRLPRAPLIPGHEIGAQVTMVGERVSDYQAGDRVFIAPKVPCMTCYYCRKGNYPGCTNVKDRLPGGFAEYILVPPALIEKGTRRLPDQVTYDQSTFIEPLACVIRAQNMAEVKAEQTILVMGCGMSGLLHLKLAKIRKANVIAVDVNPNRLEMARKMGADLVINAGEFQIQSNLAEIILLYVNRLPDVVMVCTSALSAIQSAWQAVDKGGAVVFFAVPGPEAEVLIPLNDFWMKEIKVLTSYYCGPQDIDDAIKLIDPGRTEARIDVDCLITHRLPLKDTAYGFKLVMAGDQSIKVIIQPNPY